MKTIEKVNRKCPRCKSNNMHLIEITECSITWEVRNGSFDYDDGTLEPGAVKKVLGRCLDCNHEWRFKRVMHISNLIGEQQ